MPWFACALAPLAHAVPVDIIQVRGVRRPFHTSVRSGRLNEFLHMHNGKLFLLHKQGCQALAFYLSQSVDRGLMWLLAKLSVSLVIFLSVVRSRGYPHSVRCCAYSKSGTSDEVYTTTKGLISCIYSISSPADLHLWSRMWSLTPVLVGSPTISAETKDPYMFDDRVWKGN